MNYLLFPPEYNLQLFNSKINSVNKYYKHRKVLYTSKHPEIHPSIQSIRTLIGFGVLNQFMVIKITQDRPSK